MMVAPNYNSNSQIEQALKSVEYFFNECNNESEPINNDVIKHLSKVTTLWSIVCNMDIALFREFAKMMGMVYITGYKHGKESQTD